MKPGPLVLPVAGLGGGAGTSTVALAVGGLLAWAGRRVVVVGADDLLRLCGLGGWEGPGLSELSALAPDEAAVEVPLLARPVAGVDGLAVLAGPGGPAGTLPATAGWPVDAVVVDRRQRTEAAQVLVARPDGCLDRAAAAEAPVLVAGEGPLDRRGVRRRLGREPGWLPDDARVARAGLAGRVPAGLPGTWLAAVRDGLSPA